MERIKSFTINHNILTPGFYISRVDDGDIITYDLRTRKPNAGDYMDNATMHSVEHMIATYIRNSEISDNVIYFEPMECQTGFQLVVKKVFKQTVDHEGDVFGKSAIECGHYENLDINLAKTECAKYLEVLNSWTNMEFSYPTK